MFAVAQPCIVLVGRKVGDFFYIFYVTLKTKGSRWPLYRSPVLIGPSPGDLVLNLVKVVLIILVANNPMIIPMKFQ